MLITLTFHMALLLSHVVKRKVPRNEQDKYSTHTGLLSFTLNGTNCGEFEVSRVIGFQSTSDRPHCAWQSIRRQSNNRTGNCVYRQFDAVVHPYFAHHFRNMSLDCTFCNTERCTDFLVGEPCHQHF